MAAKSKPIEVLSTADLALGEQTGATGARQRITHLVTTAAHTEGEKYIDEGEGTSPIVTFLAPVKVLEKQVS